MALHAGNFREAIGKLKQSLTLGAPAFVTANLAYAQGKSGDPAGAMATLAELKKSAPGGKVAPYNLALVYLGLGDHARALDNLEQAYLANSQQMVWLKVDWTFDPLRSDPRFIALMKRLNFIP